MTHSGNVFYGHRRELQHSVHCIAELRTLVASHYKDVALVQQLLSLIVYGMVDGQNVGVEMIRGTTFTGSVVWVGIKRPFHPSVLVVQDVAVDLIAELAEEWEVWARRWRWRCVAHGECRHRCCDILSCHGVAGEAASSVGEWCALVKGGCAKRMWKAGVDVVMVCQSA